MINKFKVEVTQAVTNKIAGVDVLLTAVGTVTIEKHAYFNRPQKQYCWTYYIVDEMPVARIAVDGEWYCILSELEDEEVAGFEEVDVDALHDYIEDAIDDNFIATGSFARV